LTKSISEALSNFEAVVDWGYIELLKPEQVGGLNGFNRLLVLLIFSKGDTHLFLTFNTDCFAFYTFFSL
jgi:hypothetical protein